MNVDVDVDVVGNGDVEVGDRSGRHQADRIAATRTTVADPEDRCNRDRRRLVADLHVAVAINVHDYVHADDHVDVDRSPRSV